MSGAPDAGRFHLASPRNAALLGALVLVLTGALPVVGVLLHTTTASLTAAVSIVAVILAVAAVGLVVAWHQPGNSIGWLLLAASAWLPLTIVASGYAVYVYHIGHRGIPGLAPLALFVSQQFTFVIVVFPLITLLFPEGRLPSARWRPVLWAYLVLCLSLPVSTGAATAVAFAGHHVRVLSDGSLAAADNPPSWTALIFFGAVALAWLGAAGHQAASWRRSAGERRQQLKWLISGTVVCAVLGIWALATNSAIWEVAILGLIALPASMGVAILRYRLYDIDRLISRTLGYALVTGLLVGVYAGLVLLATQVLGFSSTWAVAASTLAAAALFSPVRRRVQRVVDRRFNRARYHADTLVTAFSAGLKDAVDLDAVGADLVGVTRQALEPAHVGLWLPGGPR